MWTRLRSIISMMWWSTRLCIIHEHMLDLVLLCRTRKIPTLNLMSMQYNTLSSSVTFSSDMFNLFSKIDRSCCQFFSTSVSCRGTCVCSGHHYTHMWSLPLHATSQNSTLITCLACSSLSLTTLASCVLCTDCSSPKHRYKLVHTS